MCAVRGEITDTESFLVDFERKKEDGPLETVPTELNQGMLYPVIMWCFPRIPRKAHAVM
jgi:hypothetical protein